MRPEDFEHLLAAAAQATGDDEFVVVGSQAILGSYAKPPHSMLVFHLAFGYSAHLRKPTSLTARSAMDRPFTSRSATTRTASGPRRRRPRRDGRCGWSGVRFRLAWPRSGPRSPGASRCMTSCCLNASPAVSVTGNTPPRRSMRGSSIRPCSARVRPTYLSPRTRVPRSRRCCESSARRHEVRATVYLGNKLRVIERYPETASPMNPGLFAPQIPT